MDLELECILIRMCFLQASLSLYLSLASATRMCDVIPLSFFAITTRSRARDQDSIFVCAFIKIQKT
jgi:hypothetical protein